MSTVKDYERTRIAITGATGALGGRVAQRLADRGIAQRLLVRDSARAPRLPNAAVRVAGEYADRSAMARALDGVETLFLVSGRESPNRIAEHRSAIDAAVDAGVRRVVYTSFVGAAPDATFTLARDHFATEQYIRQTGLAFTFLRDNLYVEYAPTFATPDGAIAAPAGAGKAAFVTRDDVADVAAVVLLRTDDVGRTYDITGREALSLAEVAAELTRASRRQVTYRSETVAEAYASRAKYHAAAFEVAGWVTSYLAIAAGDLAAVSTVVPDLTGHPAQTLADHLAAHPASYAHLLAPA